MLPFRVPAPICLLLSFGHQAAHKAALASGFPRGKASFQVSFRKFLSGGFYCTPREPSMQVPWVQIQPHGSRGVVRLRQHAPRDTGLLCSTIF